MATPSSLTPEHIGNQANQVLNYAANRLQSAVNGFRAAIISGGCSRMPYSAIAYGLRQEVPFERWFFDQGFQKPIDDPMEAMKARAWALLAAIEGGIRITAEVASLLYAQVFEPKESERHLDVLKAQWQGFTLSLLAVVSPNAAKEKAHHSEGSPLIGAYLLNWKWGTLYGGKLDAPFWHVECRHYPWVDRPST